MFVPKKEDNLRFCVDYRRLNAVTERDSYPIPRMEKCIVLLGKTKMFLTLDANSGYWQIEMDNKDVDKTVFVTQHGLFQ